MKDNAESSIDLDMLWTWVGGILLLLSPFIVMWLIGTTSSSGDSESMTQQEAAQYEEYRSEQLQNEHGAHEACIDQMTQDVERYGEWVIDTYDC